MRLLTTIQALMALLPMAELLPDPAAAEDEADGLTVGDARRNGNPGECQHGSEFWMLDTLQVFEG